MRKKFTSTRFTRVVRPDVPVGAPEPLPFAPGCRWTSSGSIDALGSSPGMAIANVTPETRGSACRRRISSYCRIVYLGGGFGVATRDGGGRVMTMQPVRDAYIGNI